MSVRKHHFKPLVLALAAVTLQGCISPWPDSRGRYTAPIGGAPVISNETPYSAALRCMSGFVRQRPVRIAVGQIADYTGKAEADGSGRKVTAGAALMAMSALNKAGVHMVERFDTSVAEMELKYANNKLIGDDQHPNPQAGEFRKILAGSIPGSDYYIVGGITELNFNIRSENANGSGGSARTNGTWTGTGVTSTTARNNGAHNTTLGNMSGADYLGSHGGTFDGATVAANAAVVKYTYYGDTDFNGAVNFDDYVRTDSGFNNNRSGWLNGDADGNGQVNFDDYVLVDLAFNTQSGIL